MVDRDVVIGKSSTIDRCISRVVEVRSRATSGLLPVDVEDIVVLNITRAVQAAADLAAHVAAAEGYGLPDSLRSSFTLLEKHGVIDAALAGHMRQAMAFRNIAVHAYDTIDPKVVEAIGDKHVDDLRRFAAAMVARYAG